MWDSREELFGNKAPRRQTTPWAQGMKWEKDECFFKLLSPKIFLNFSFCILQYFPWCPERVQPGENYHSDCYVYIHKISMFGFWFHALFWALGGRWLQWADSYFPSLCQDKAWMHSWALVTSFWTKVQQQWRQGWSFLQLKVGLACIVINLNVSSQRDFFSHVPLQFHWWILCLFAKPWSATAHSDFSADIRLSCVTSDDTVWQ